MSRQKAVCRRLKAVAQGLSRSRCAPRRPLESTLMPTRAVARRASRSSKKPDACNRLYGLSLQRSHAVGLTIVPSMAICLMRLEFRRPCGGRKHCCYTLFFLSHSFFRLQQGFCPNLHHYGGAARSSPSGSSAPSLASQGRTGSSSKLWACARNAASAARAVQRRVSAAPAASRAHGARSRARARASRRSSANAWLSKRPPTASPKTLLLRGQLSPHQSPTLQLTGAGLAKGRVSSSVPRKGFH